MGQISRVDVFIDNQMLRTTMPLGPQPESELQQYKRAVREQALGIQPEAQVAAGKQDWQEYSNCLGANPDVFFPDRGTPLKAAKAICNDCVVQEDCLEYALENGEKFGVWGGTSERQRRSIRKARNIANRAISNG